MTEPQQEFSDDLKNIVVAGDVGAAGAEALLLMGATDTRQNCSTTVCSDDANSLCLEHCNSALCRDPSVSVKQPTGYPILSSTVCKHTFVCTKRNKK